MIWKTKTLAELCKMYQPKTLSKKQLKSDGKYFVYGANGIIGKYDKYNHEKSQLLITCRGATCGSINISEPFSWINGNAMVIQPNENEISKEFLKYLFKGPIDFSKIITGSAQPQITRESLNPISVSYPSLQEQQHIVTKLDTLLAEINKNINFIKKKEQEVYTLKENILSAEFRPSLENKKLNEVCKIVNGGTPDTKNKSYWGGNIQWLTPKDMGKLKNVNVNNTLRQLTEEGLKNSSASLIPENSIILSCRAPIGHLAINNVPMSFNQGCKGLVPDSTILNYKYLYYFLLSSKKLLNNLGTGTTFKEISSKVLSGVKINLPSLDVQKKIIDKIESIVKELQKLENINKIKVENYLNLKTTLLNKELLSKAA